MSTVTVTVSPLRAFRSVIDAILAAQQVIEDINTSQSGGDPARAAALKEALDACVTFTGTMAAWAQARIVLVPAVPVSAEATPVTAKGSAPSEAPPAPAPAPSVTGVVAVAPPPGPPPANAHAVHLTPAPFTLGQG